MAKLRKYGTCFFEQYAQISLSTLVGSDFDDLVNRDRPDLQSPDSLSIGIEVTRAMEESKSAAKRLLKDISGILPAPGPGDDPVLLAESGYAYGLREGRYIGIKELEYWSMALPLRRIIESKVSKVGNGFYGEYRRMGLYVFCNDPLTPAEATRTYKYTMGLQKYQDIRFNRLYLAEVSSLYVCNLDDGLSASSRLLRYPISQEQRQDFYLQAIRQQLE